MKQAQSLEQATEGLPQEFATYMKYCRDLKFDEDPDYAYLRKLFKDLMAKEGYKYDNKYDWTMLEKYSTNSPDGEEDLKDLVNHTYLGLSGVIWCVLAGLCYGTMNVFAKLAYSRGMLVSRFVMMRFAVLAIASYIFGKLVRKTDFNLTIYEPRVIGIVFLRSALSLLSKTMQYAAISFIPLSLSSCISFTTGPIFAGLLAFVLIREKLSISEVVAILCGIAGTTMLTMP